jgi:UDP-N-acetylmuramyl pentapeptide phosphotransferase/UDP-N-acetylglucosamine-1-phosphate transferase
MNHVPLILILVISYTGTFLVRKIALYKQILDIPNSRSSHTHPTPRGGGIAIVTAWYTGIFLMYQLRLIERDLFFALVSGIVLAFVSFLDDVITLKPWIRILIQLITVVSGLYFIDGLKVLYIGDFKIPFPYALNLVIIIGAIWYINLYNFLDGIDGYASVEAIAIASGIYLITGNSVLLILIFSVLGFLIWNWPKAKIFMGDIGSTQLGYLFIILSIYFNNNLEFNFIGFLILGSLFWFDATITLYRRWRNHEKLSEAHKKHVYQRINQYGYSHQKTILVSIFINIIFIGLIFLSERLNISYLITFSICMFINAFIVIFVDKRFPFIKSSIS